MRVREGGNGYLGNPRILIFLLLCLALLIGLIWGTVYWLENNAKPPEEKDDVKSYTLEWNGDTYIQKSGLINLLLIGVDADGELTSSGSFRNDYRADYISLISFDVLEKTCRILQLNRDTITAVNRLGMGFSSIGKEDMQLALAYSYGDGRKTSCQNTVKAVSALLGSIEINYYLSMTMDGIAVLNDSVGGVLVHVEDDFSSVDPTLVMGETVLLKGEHATNFVRSRSGVGDQTNLTRMKRQKQYMEAFYEAWKTAIADNQDYFRNLSEELAEYHCTNCSVNWMGAMGERIKSYTVEPVYTLDGTAEAVMESDGVEYMHFTPDSNSLRETIICMFYNKK
ncbi:MAG: LCP family protein [Clostridia bacterium]|nr:LCP family protein [Clostridia bacterium]